MRSVFSYLHISASKHNTGNNTLLSNPKHVGHGIPLHSDYNFCKLIMALFACFVNASCALCHFNKQLKTITKYL